MNIKKILEDNKKENGVLISFRLKKQNIEFLKTLRDSEGIVMSSLLDSLINDFKKQYEENYGGKNEKGI